MRLSILRERLYRGALLSSKIVSSKSNLPILSNLLCTASEDNTLKIESSNLELSVRLKLPAKVEEPGQITIPARKFTEFLSLLSDDTLEITTDLRQLVVKTDKNQASFVTMPASDFPELPNRGANGTQIMIEPDVFRRMVKKVCFAAASGDTHPVLTGVLFDPSESGVLSIVATDSFRLSLFKIQLPEAIQGSIIIPAQALIEVDHLLADNADKEAQVGVFFSREDNQIFFQVGEVEISSRLLEADYPPYQRIFPAQFVTTGIFERPELIEAIRTTSLFASREGQAITVNVDPANGMVNLSARSSEVGSHTGQVSGQIEGETIQLGFNSRYLLEAIGSFDTSHVRMKISGVSAPVLIEPTEGSGEYQHIVMPMSLNEAS